MPNLFIARQPIYDRKLEVFAYELLYRAEETEHAPEGLGDHATYTVITNALSEIGLKELVGNAYAFINLTRGFFVGDNPGPFAGEQVVVEVLEDIVVEEEVIAGVKRLAGQGHIIALDDFIYDESLRGLVELADIIKIDLMAMDRNELADQVQQLKEFDVKLLAEKVETQEEYECCRELGFDYFQGYFFCKPKVLKQQRIPTNQMTVMQLLSELQDPNISVEKLGELISHDVSLSYRLLKYVNSAFFSLPSKVDSLSRAITFLGLITIKQWAMVLSMSQINDKPHELLVTSLLRAKMCQLLTKGKVEKESAFVVGLFSVLDALLDRPLPDLLATLTLADNINDALLERKGSAGEILDNVIAYEQGQWDAITIDSDDLENINKAYYEALSWTNNVQNSI